MRKTFIVGIIIVLAVGGLFAAMKKNAPKPPSPTTKELWAERGVPVSTGVVLRGDMEQTIEITGDIQALEKVTLSAKIPGRVARVLAREGEIGRAHV